MKSKQRHTYAREKKSNPLVTDKGHLKDLWTDPFIFSAENDTEEMKKIKKVWSPRNTGGEAEPLQTAKKTVQTHISMPNK